MYIVIYEFQVLQGEDQRFREAWEALTAWFYTHAGSLGSRLHAPEGNTYLAYAQWPNRETLETARDLLTPKARGWSETMRACCSAIEVRYQGAVLTDLLKEKPSGTTKAS